MANLNLEVHKKAESEYGGYNTAQLVGGDKHWSTRSGVQPPLSMVFRIADGPKSLGSVTLKAPNADLKDMVKDFEVTAGDAAETLKPLGAFTLEQKAGAQTFPVPPTMAQFVGLTVKSNHGGRYIVLGKFLADDGEAAAAAPAFASPPPPQVDVKDAEREAKITLAVQKKAESEYGAAYSTGQLVTDGTYWSSEGGRPLPQTMVFKAPGARVIRSFALLPPGSSQDGCVKDFEISVGEREDAMRAAGSFTMAKPDEIQFFEIEETAATLIGLKITSNHGGNYVTLGRVHAFGVRAADAAKLLGITVLSGVGAEEWPQNGALRTLVRQEGEVLALGYSHDGLLVCAGGAGGTVYTWDANTGEQMGQLTAHMRSTVLGLAMYPLAPVAVHCSVHGIKFHLCGRAGKVPAFEAQHKDTVAALDFARDGDHMASGDQGGEIIVWDLWTGKPFRRFEHGAAVNALRYHPDGDRIAAACEDGSFRILRMASGDVACTVAAAHAGPCRSAAFSPDGKWLATCGLDKRIKIWSADNGAPVATLEGHGDAVNAVAFRPRGELLLASASDDRSVRLWKMPEGGSTREISFGASARALAWSPDGATLATGAGTRVQLFSI